MIFYQKYIFIENLITELHQLDLSDVERQHLASLIDSSLHHAILDEILSNLSESDKKEFLHQLNQDPENDQLMEFLKQKVDNIEEKIARVSEELVKEMHKDLKESKRLKP